MEGFEEEFLKLLARESSCQQRVDPNARILWTFAKAYGFSIQG